MPQLSPQLMQVLEQFRQRQQDAAQAQTQAASTAGGNVGGLGGGAAGAYAGMHGSPRVSDFLERGKAAGEKTGSGGIMPTAGLAQRAAAAHGRSMPAQTAHNAVPVAAVATPPPPNPSVPVAPAPARGAGGMTNMAQPSPPAQKQAFFGRLLGSLVRGAKATPGMVGRGALNLGQGMANFGRGALATAASPITSPASYIARGSFRPFGFAAGGASGPMERAGRLAGGAALAGGAGLAGYHGLQHGVANMADQQYEELRPKIEEDANKYLQSIGVMNQHGKIDPWQALSGGNTTPTSTPAPQTKAPGNDLLSGALGFFKNNADNLSPFMRGFIASCRSRGLDMVETKAAADRAMQQFPEVKDEFEKAAGLWDQAVRWGGRMFGRGAAPVARAEGAAARGAPAAFSHAPMPAFTPTPGVTTIPRPMPAVTPVAPNVHGMGGAGGAAATAPAAAAGWGELGHRIGPAVSSFGTNLMNYGARPAIGGAMGAVTAEDMGVPWWIGAPLGAFAATPAHMRAGMGGITRPVQSAAMMGFGGHAIDELGQQTGMWQNPLGLGRLGGYAGLGLGGARVGAQAMGNTSLARSLAGAARGTGRFAQGAVLDPAMHAIAYPFRAAGSVYRGQGLPGFFAGGLGRGTQALGRVAGIGAAGVLGLRTAASGIRDLAHEGTRSGAMHAFLGDEQGNPGILDVVQHMMRQGGMIGENGQFQLPGGGMGGMGGHMDSILHALGMDPSRMSGMQKIMTLGGLGVFGGGAMAGAGGAAGLGALSAAAGGLPQFMRGGGGGQRPAAPAPGTPGEHYTPSEQFGQPPRQPQQGPGRVDPRNEYLHQLMLQGRIQPPAVSAQ